MVNYQPDLQHYKVVVYNNTIWNPTGKGIVRYGCDWFPFAENESHFGWDYNNLIDSSNSIYDLWFTGAAINVFNGCTGSRTPYSNPDISNYVNSHNYYYRPDDPAVFAYGTPTVFYTAAEFEAQTVTGAPRVAYTNALDPGNLLYAGTTGADRFVTLGSHTMEGSTTIANGGVGGDHPYLAGVTLPTYVGAANPDDNAWAAGVMSLTDVNVLQTCDPYWVEGAPPVDCTNPDEDGDGHDSIACGGDDCDDQVGTSYPGATEIAGDGIDQDCDGSDLVLNADAGLSPDSGPVVDAGTAEAKPDGCNCRTAGSAPGSIPVWPFVLLAALVGMVRSRRRA